MTFLKGFDNHGLTMVVISDTIIIIYTMAKVWWCWYSWCSCTSVHYLPNRCRRCLCYPCNPCFLSPLWYRFHKNICRQVSPGIYDTGSLTTMIQFLPKKKLSSDTYPCFSPHKAVSKIYNRPSKKSKKQIIFHKEQQRGWLVIPNWPFGCGERGLAADPQLHAPLTLLILRSCWCPPWFGGGWTLFLLTLSTDWYTLIDLIMIFN